MNPREGSILDKEVQIRLRPRPIIKGFILLLLLMVVFFAGRFSVDTTSETNPTAAVVHDAAPVKEESSFSWKEFFTGLLPDFSSKDKPTAAVTGATISHNDSAAAPSVNATQPPVPTSEPAAENVTPSEPVITSYSKVALSLNDVTKEWKETWGKIIKIDYTIKNNEAGTIHPAYLIMNVEGYDDIDKKISLPLSSKNILAGQSYSLVINVPQGFAYNQVTAGDLSSVKISISLYDEADKLMSSYSRDVNLNG